MTYVYETPTHRRLILGPADAPSRVCLPVDADLYAQLRTLPPLQLAAVLPALVGSMRAALARLQAPIAVTLRPEEEE